MFLVYTKNLKELQFIIYSAAKYLSFDYFISFLPQKATLQHDI